MAPIRRTRPAATPTWCWRSARASTTARRRPGCRAIRGTFQNPSSYTSMSITRESGATTRPISACSPTREFPGPAPGRTVPAQGGQGGKAQGVASRARGLARRWDAYIQPKFEIHASPLRPDASSPIAAPCCQTTPSFARLRHPSQLVHAVLECAPAPDHAQYLGLFRHGLRPSSILGRSSRLRPSLRIDLRRRGFTMVPHVLCTAVEYNIPAIWVVWNNFSWAAIRDLQYAYFDGREIGTGFYQGRRRSRITRTSPPGPAPPASRGSRLPNPRISRCVGPRRRAQQALPHRRACRRQHSAAGYRCLGAARRFRTRSRYSARSTFPEIGESRTFVPA